MTQILAYDEVDKSFFGVRVLRSVSFTLEESRVLGLVGENGAGKSTLMNILGGLLEPDGGEVRLYGQSYKPNSAAHAQKQGVAFIHQELNLFPNLSVAENIFISSFPQRSRLPFPLIDKDTMRARTRALLDSLDLHIAPETLVEQLSPGERQLVEIAKALSFAARLIIFDEPTTSLTARETERLFTTIERLRAQSGIAMIYISHRLEDVRRLSDELLILRDGAVVASGPTRDFTEERMISLMVGRSLGSLFPQRTTPPLNEPILEINNLSEPGFVSDINLSLHRGEVLGLAGLMGAGRSELARLIYGLDSFREGEIKIRGRRVGRPTPKGSMRRGLAFLTEDRREEGLLMDASVAENVALVALRSFAGGGVVRKSALQKAVGKIVEALKIKSSKPEMQMVKSLSGGNQQKVVLGKWLLNEPEIFILDEPTRGIDVGAKYEIYRLINELAERGAGVLLISSEVEELIGMCDRILVMHDGRIQASYGRSEFDREKILRSALGGAGDIAP